MHSLLYSSAATMEFKESDLVALLEQARKFNSEHNITGLLLFHNNSFMQLIEGKKDIIMDLFEYKIFRGSRHDAVTEYYNRPIEKRVFSEWSMGFEKLDNNHFIDIPDFSNLVNDYQPLLKANQTIAEELLAMFITAK